MPILFQCSCGKKLQTRDELAGKRVKCPGCGGLVAVPQAVELITTFDQNAPPQTATATSHPPKTRPHSAEELPDLLPLEPAPPSAASPGPAVGRAAPRGFLCPTCKATFYPGDVVCIKCGTQVGHLGKQRAEKKLRFYEYPLFKLGVTIVALVIIGFIVYNYFLKQQPESEKVETNPAKLLIKEIENQKSRNLDKVVSAMIKCFNKKMSVLSILEKELKATADAFVRGRTLSAIRILAYYGLFTGGELSYYKIDEIRDASAPEMQPILLDIFYLISDPKPEYEIVDDYENITKYADDFKEFKQPVSVVAKARKSIQKFADDKNEALRLKALTALVVLGEMKYLEPLAELLKGPTTEVKHRVQEILVSSLERLKGMERWQVVNCLVKITGKTEPGFQYAKDAKESEQLVVISKWQDWWRSQRK